METAIAVTEAEKTRAMLAQVVEAKVTRTELIDMVIDRLLAEMSAERDALQKAKPPEPTVGARTALKPLQGAGARVDVTISPSVWGSDKGKIKVCVEGMLPADWTLPQSYTRAREESVAHEKKIHALSAKISRLKNGRQRARSELVKHALETTPEGAKILQAVDGLVESLRAKLTEPA